MDSRDPTSNDVFDDNSGFQLFKSSSKKKKKRLSHAASASAVKTPQQQEQKTVEEAEPDLKPEEDAILQEHGVDVAKEEDAPDHHEGTKKAQAEDGTASTVDGGAASLESKKRKRIEKLKEKKKNKQLAAKGKGNHALGKNPADGGGGGGAPAAAATRSSGGGGGGRALFWAKYAGVMGGKLTDLELRPENVPEGAFLPVAAPPEPLVDFVKAHVPGWKVKLQLAKGQNRKFARAAAAPQARGSPRVLVVCAGARRCVALLKGLAVFRCPVAKLFAKHMKIQEQQKLLKKCAPIAVGTPSSCPVAKLFAKHMKIQEQQKLLKKCAPIAVGTPSRLLKLAQFGDLCLESTELIIFDMGKDVKQMTILDVNGVKEDLMDFFKTTVLEPVRSRFNSDLPLKLALL